MSKTLILKKKNPGKKTGKTLILKEKPYKKGPVNKRKVA